MLSWCNIVPSGKTWPEAEPFPNHPLLRDEQVALARHVSMCWDTAARDAAIAPDRLKVPGSEMAQEAVVFGYWAGIARGVDREQEMVRNILTLAEALPEDERLGCVLEALRHRAKD